MADGIIEFCNGLGYSYRESAELSLYYYIDYESAIKRFVKHQNINSIENDIRCVQFRISK